MAFSFDPVGDVLRIEAGRIELQEAWTCPTCHESYHRVTAVKRRCCLDTWEHDILPALIESVRRPDLRP